MAEAAESVTQESEDLVRIDPIWIVSDPRMLFQPVRLLFHWLKFLAKTSEAGPKPSGMIKINYPKLFRPGSN